jgi:hypothetical protein
VPSTTPVVVDSGPSDNNVACGAGPKRTLSADEQERIVGGTTATRNSWPFVVSQLRVLNRLWNIYIVVPVIDILLLGCAV